MLRTAARHTPALALRAARLSAVARARSTRLPVSALVQRPHVPVPCVPPRACLTSLSQVPAPAKQDSQPQQQHERPSETWVERYLPASWHPYARLARWDRPIGSLLLFWPCVWSASLAAPLAGHDAIPLRWLVTFGVGAFVMRGAGCTINDMWDRDFDRRVARTRSRPIASGEVTRLGALKFLAAQLSVGLGILLTTDLYTIAVGASSLGLVATYPLFKRFTYWPQLMLGLTFNWGAFVGWSALHHSINWSACLPLYAAGVSWTMIYDTIYGHQDKRDDAKLGLKSTSLLFAQHTPQILTGFAGSMLAGLTAAGLATTQGPLYWAGMLVVARHLVWQIRTVDLDDPVDCHRKFISNKDLGMFIAAAIISGNIWRPEIHGVPWASLPIFV